jgi:hypothetical protein
MTKKFRSPEGFILTIGQDEDAESPRDWDNLGTMHCSHKRYRLGDKQIPLNGDGLSATLKLDEPSLCLPLFLMDHSGLSMSTNSSDFRACDSRGWDWGQVGWIAVSKAEVRKEWKVKRISPKLKQKVLDALRSEVEVYDQYLRGDVYWYSVTNSDGSDVSGCGGVFGLDYLWESIAEATQVKKSDWEEVSA